MYQLALSLHKCEQGALALQLGGRYSGFHHGLHLFSWIIPVPDHAGHYEGVG